MEAPEDFGEMDATGAMEEPRDATMPEDFLEGTGLDTHILGARAKPRLSDEERLAREVARRRQVELDRRHRIFDAKRRTIGVDLEALEAQKAENQQRRQQERAEARASERELLRTNQLLTMVETDKMRARREMEKGCKDFSLQNLNFQSRREFDLNDPAARRKAPPTRMGDEDPRLGPSSMQKFNGEDLTREERKRQQQLETVHFIEQQKFEKAMLAKNNGEDGRAIAQELAEITAMCNEMEENEARARRDLAKQQQDENLAMADEHARRRRHNIQQEMEANARELEFHANDPFLQELGGRQRNRSGADGTSGGGADFASGDDGTGGYVRGVPYKGSTRAQRVRVAQQQLAQADENYMRSGYDRLEDHVYAKQQEQTRKQMLVVEREKSRMKRAMAEQVARENRGLHLEQKANTKRTDQLYTNEFRPEFFEQFGTTCR